MYCECGCGELAPIATVNHTGRGYVKGRPLRFIRGHAGRILPEYTVSASGCWLWRGTIQGGYGYLMRDGRRWRAHRYFYERANGPVPAGLQLDHICRNRACVNPEHLEPVTPLENARRGHAARNAVVVALPAMP